MLCLPAVVMGFAYLYHQCAMLTLKPIKGGPATSNGFRAARSARPCASWLECRVRHASRIGPLNPRHGSGSPTRRSIGCASADRILNHRTPFASYRTPGTADVLSDAFKMHAYEIHTYKVHSHEVHSYEVHA